MNPGKCRNVFVAVLLILTLISITAFSQTKLDKKITKVINVSPASRQANPDAEIILPAGKFKMDKSPESADISKGGMMLLRFKGELDDADLNMLEKSQVKLLDYLGGNTYRVRMAAGSSLVGSSLVAAAMRQSGSQKIAAGLNARLTSTISEDVTRVVVEFAEDTGSEQISHILAQKGFSAAVQPGSSLVVISLSAEQIHDLAEDENVISLELFREKKIHNRISAKKIGVKNARNSHGLSGDGVNVGIWDGGAVQSSHKEFEGRVNVITNSGISEHATHVAGSIGAAGKKAKAKGMAYDASIYSYDFNGDIAAEVKKAKTGKGVYLSNHSYGYGKGWEIDYVDGEWAWVWWGTDYFGYYSSESKSLDKAVTGKKVTMVFSAGNDRNDEPKGVDKYYDATRRQWIYEKPVGKDGPYNILGPLGVSKNIITVGATVGNKSMSTFSSWGPTGDGRLKPDVSAPGVNIYSTVPYNSYGKMSGTSMAAPITTGSIALVMEHYKNLYGKYPEPDMVKALLAVTCSDLAPTGPDYKYGYGVIDIESLTDFMADYPNMELVEVNKVNKNKTNVYNLSIANNVKELRVILVWLDPAGNTLVNNLDLKLIQPNGKVHLPWKLDPEKPDKAATKGVNILDNVEMVSISNPASGEGWKIHVKATALKKGTSQKYALVVFPK